MARHHQLDSLRGLAALAVVFHHLLFVLPAFGGEAMGHGIIYRLVSTGPIHVIWAGHQAVVFFFVLSGFVLSLPFYEGKISVGAFMVKRLCRICIPYWTAVLVAFTAFALFNRGPIPELSIWLGSTWCDPVTARTVAQHVLLIGSFANCRYDPVLWSLVVEMRVSLVFPLLMLCLARCRWQTSVLLGAGCYVIGRAGDWGSNHLWQSPRDYFSTLMYVYQFIVGALLAKHAAALGLWWRRLSPFHRRVLFTLACIGYAYVFWFPAEMRESADRIGKDFPTVAAICVFIIAALNSKKLSDCLANPALAFLGKVSYSLYLLHGIAVLSLVHLLYGQWPLGLILAAVIPVSVVAATASFYLVELPAIHLGRRLASRFGPPPAHFRG